MPAFMLLLHQSPDRFQNIAPDEIQRIIGRYVQWREDLLRQNRLKGGEKLTNDGGRRLRVQANQVSVTDGPYSEAAEVLGGYFIIEATDYDEAVAITRSCPHLSGDQWIELRQIEPVH
jgi:hypothetical protein